MSNKYIRTVTNVDGDAAVEADVYEILEAFNVTCPARQQAIKKLLCSGLRGKGSATQDLTEAAQAVDRAIQLERKRPHAEEVSRPLGSVPDFSRTYVLDKESARTAIEALSGRLFGGKGPAGKGRVRGGLSEGGKPGKGAGRKK